MENESEIVSLNADDIKRQIFIIRGKQVMLNRDLAELYGYEIKWNKLRADIKDRDR